MYQLPSTECTHIARRPQHIIYTNTIPITNQIIHNDNNNSGIHGNFSKIN